MTQRDIKLSEIEVNENGEVIIRNASFAKEMESFLSQQKQRGDQTAGLIDLRCKNTDCSGFNWTCGGTA